MNVLLSIKPEYAKAIFSGEKEYEFRRKIFKRNNINKIYLYSNSDEQKIRGYFTFGKILKGEPKEIWEKVKNKAYISEEKFFNYFKGTNTAYAIKIKKVKEFPSPIDPFKELDNFNPPQSFQYISDQDLHFFELDIGKQIQYEIEDYIQEI
ncbi:hypothetical protein [Methanonatronarchaeum sp. AMET-Sl]|uniref:hypothetical protein n=1 Tax=Methanonatronarchaeum sp. AMET-Sl TaxID=3037654 RepID=UPI00244E0FC6|nr:hypothetical protein [Methanonatronarchaeum sp. AMET-Sl]WGI17942.1 hypothetical protein QEN48_02760 [Methanonatronarchaeum sp. AMET-Sl]